MNVTIRGVEIRDGGMVRCRHCDRSSTFKGSVSLLVFDMPERLWAVNVANGRVLHACGRTQEWWCEKCGPIDSDSWNVSYARKIGSQPTCPDCHGGLEATWEPAPSVDRR